MEFQRKIYKKFQTGLECNCKTKIVDNNENSIFHNRCTKFSSEKYSLNSRIIVQVCDYEVFHSDIYKKFYKIDINFLFYNKTVYRKKIIFTIEIIIKLIKIISTLYLYLNRLLLRAEMSV